MNAIGNHKPQPVSALSLARYQQLADRDGGMRCAYCLTELPPEYLSRDHIVPASRGGHRRHDNLVLACRPCNNEKADRTPAEWAPGRVWAVAILNKGHRARLGGRHRAAKGNTLRADTTRFKNHPAIIIPPDRPRPLTFKAFVYIKFCATCGRPVDIRNGHPQSHLLLDDASNEGVG